MDFKDFKWTVDKVDDPQSCLNLLELASIRQNLLSMVAECYVEKRIDNDLELTWNKPVRRLRSS
jgi:hypothetical protein